MNEVTNIHLGRQSFVISVDAHKMLRDYLAAIRHQSGASGKEVADEVELRIAELLAERGVTGEKVILAEDVAYVKEQLGAPSDFKDDADERDDAPKKTDEPLDQSRRLFRDGDHAMVAGVCAGLGAYFNVDPVIFRILFVVGLISGGWGIILYVVLWLIVPEAKTASERLQMRGKAVTVDNLKEIVDRADVGEVAHRVSRGTAVIVAAIAKVVLAFVGVMATICAVGLLVFVAAAGLYAALHGGHVVHGAVTFPLGLTEGLAVAGGLGVLASVAAFVLATGVAMVRRKWLVPGWGVAAMAALLLLSAVVCGASMPDTVQNVQRRYDAQARTVTRQLPPFHTVRIEKGTVDIPVTYVSYDPERAVSGSADASGTYQVVIHYLAGVPVDQIKTVVKDDTLIIDGRDFNPDANWDCNGLCIGEIHYFSLEVESPGANPEGLPVLE